MSSLHHITIRCDNVPPKCGHSQTNAAVGGSRSCPEGTYWSRRTVGRRTVLRGAGLGSPGWRAQRSSAAAAPTKSRRSRATSAAKKSAVAVVTPGGGKASRTRCASSPASTTASCSPRPPSGPAGERALRRHAAHALPRPAAHGLQQDAFVHHQHDDDYTKNKLVRGEFGPSANQLRLIHVEPDLAANWEASPGRRPCSRSTSTRA